MCCRHPHVHTWAHIDRRSRGRAHSGRRAERCRLRRAARLHRTPHTSHARRQRALPSRSTPRTCALTPRTAQFVMRVQRAHRREGNSPTLSDPKIWVGLALAGLCSSAIRFGLAGGEGFEDGGQRGGGGPLPHWMYSISIAMRATRTHAEHLMR